MAIYVVTYDLKTPGKDYANLIAALRASDSTHAQLSLWFVSTSWNSAQLLEYLGAHIDPNDWLFVGAITGDWASLRMPTSAAWLKAHGL